MPLFEWERDLFVFLHGLNSESLNPLMIFVSSFIPWLPITFFLLYYVFKAQSKRNFFVILSYLVLLLAMSDSSTSYFFKNLFGRLRPCHMEELKEFIIEFGQRCGGKNGFFSSHASNSFALGAFLLNFGIIPRSYKIMTWSFLILIAYSRIYLGVHLPLDVIMGAIWGIFLSKLWIFLTKNSLKELVGA